jgi:hypothetical protein
MLLSTKVNEFRDAKGNKNEKQPSLVLAEYTAFTGMRDTTLFPRSQSGTGHQANPAGQPLPGPVPNRPSPAGDQQFGLRVGQRVSVWGELGTVVGFRAGAVLIDFGDAEVDVDPAEVKPR